jgi:Ca2+-binding RTX toxin-like protein
MGNAVANVLIGGGGHDRLNGAQGADRMEGGDGDDVYTVDDSGDRVIELAGGGTEVVLSAVSFSLAGTYVENLMFSGNAAVDGTGNALANSIIGNAAANVLTGDLGDDYLDGQGGADRMEGGAGSDTYSVDRDSDRIFEASGAAAGTADHVRTTADYTLAPNIEKLTLDGFRDINGTGNDLANEIVGNGGRNVLNGGAGADRLDGRGGFDHFIVDHEDDVVIGYFGSTNVEMVFSSASYSLAGTAIDHMRLTGDAAINGGGSSLDNFVGGNSAANTLSGGAGSDELSGGLGNDILSGGSDPNEADRFVFDTALDATNNVDRIADFTDVDTIVLNDAVFAVGEQGSLDPARIAYGAAATDGYQRIVYNEQSGAIYYDADGSGEIGAILFAWVTPGSTILNWEVTG